MLRANRMVPDAVVALFGCEGDWTPVETGLPAGSGGDGVAVAGLLTAYPRAAEAVADLVCP
nr:hypothetical protein [Actinoplanes utahensis]